MEFGIILYKYVNINIRIFFAFLYMVCYNNLKLGGII